MHIIKDFKGRTVGFCNPLTGMVEIKAKHNEYGSVYLSLGQVFRINNPADNTETLLLRSAPDCFTVTTTINGTALKERQYLIKIA